MGKIRSKNTKLEQTFVSLLKGANLRFEFQPKLPGKPDFIIDGRIAIFCDSSFWHGRNWDKLKGKLRSPYWHQHIGKTRIRDRRTNLRLRADGYRVLRFWDDTIMNAPENCLDLIQKERTKLRIS